LSDGTVWRRRILFVPGLMETGSRYYMALLQRSAKQHARTTGKTIRVRRLTDGDDGRLIFSRPAPDGMEAVLEFLPWTDGILTMRGRSYAARCLAVLPVIASYVRRGIFFRWRRWHKESFLAALVALFSLLGIVLLPGLGGLLGWLSLGWFLGTPIAVLMGLAAGTAGLIRFLQLPVVQAGQHLADAMQLAHAQARGQAREVDPGIARLTERLVRALTDPAPMDEVVICAHSYGAHLVPQAVERALARVGGTAVPGRLLTLVDLGSIYAMILPMDEAAALRASIQGLTDRPDITWLSYFAAQDGMTTGMTHPLAMHHGGVPGRWPLALSVRLRDILTPETLAKTRRDPWRCHFHYVIEGDRPMPYSLIGVLTHAGPAALGDGRWPGGQPQPPVAEQGP